MEIEVCSYDNRDFRNSRLTGNDLPVGIDDVADTIMRATGDEVSINKWHLTHNNVRWVIKPDSSCGIEICSPIMRGANGIRKIVGLIVALKSNPRISVDKRCGFHVHADVSDMSFDETGAVLAWWIKCETLFLDAMPTYRKRNRYCQHIGISTIFEHDFDCSSSEIVRRLSLHKYLTVNAYHYAKGNRPTIEFRIAEDLMCLSEIDAKNWVGLILHFIEVARAKGMPGEYRANNQWTGLCWLDFKDVMSFLKLNGELCPKLTEIKNWFIDRLKKNMGSDLTGVWSKEGRSVSVLQLDHYLNSGLLKSR